MKATKIVLFVLLGGMLAVASPVAAGDDGTEPQTPCIKTSHDPPDVIVDQACVWAVINDVPPSP